jgi:retron-type reverse transcriptase
LAALQWDGRSDKAEPKRDGAKRESEEAVVPKKRGRTTSRREGPLLESSFRKRYGPREWRKPEHPMTKVQELQRKLWAAAKQSRNRRFHQVYDKAHRMDILWEAWNRVRANGGAPGIDGATIEYIEEHGVEEFLEGIQKDLKAGEYWPQAVRRRYIPKPDGKRRPLGIPTVRDRVVQTAAKLVLEPIFEADFEECSYGFRPKRGAADALDAIRKAGNAGYDWVVDADIEKYFDSIDHDLLMEAVRQRISDRKMLKLIGRWLKAGVMDGGQVTEPERGTPQGGVISPLLSNIYLGELDRRWRSLQRGQGDDPDPVRGRLRGDVPHGGEGEGGATGGGGDPQRAEAEVESREDAHREPEQERRDVHVSGMHAQEGAVEGATRSHVSVPMAESSECGAHPATNPGSHRPSACRQESARCTRGPSTDSAGLGGLLPERQRLGDLCEGGTVREGSAQPTSTASQSAGVSGPHLH